MPEDRLPAHQLKAAHGRWANIPPEERRRIMTALAKMPRKKKDKWNWKTNRPQEDKP